MATPLSQSDIDYINRDYGSLVGKTIVNVRPLTTEEQDDLYWRGGSAVPMVIFFSDGSFIIPMADDEGNGPGGLLYEPAR